MNRPEIIVAAKPVDRALDLASLLILLGLWVITIVAHQQLPDIIPIHFDSAGEPNGFGSKATLFILPSIGTLLFVLLGALNRHPQIFNYPVEITVENAERQYTRATRFMRWLRLSLLLTFAISVAYTWISAANAETKYGPWLFAIILILTLAPLTIYLISALRKKE